jgi:WD40 repeat protein
MADVFISYSDTDRAFVTDLHSALKKISRDTWIDWISIPIGDDWRNAIFEGIDAADNFVFVVSSRSLSSPMCMEELAYASANSKRVISVLYEKPTAPLPQVLEPFQAIRFFQDGFDKTFARLVETIDTDPEWERMHSRVLTRAKEWQHGGSVLRDSDLRRAEAWSLTSPGDPARSPTELEMRFIDASRQAERKRLQLSAAVAIIASIILLVLAVSWYEQRNLAQARERQAEEASQREGIARHEAEIQRGEAQANADEASRQRNVAEERRVEAERQRRAALARQLAAQAESLIKDQPDLSALLSVESIRRRHFLENDHSLRRVLPFVGRLHPTQPPNPPGLAVVGKAEYSVAGGLVSGIDYLILLNPELRKQFLEIDHGPGTGSFSDVASYRGREAIEVALSADGKYVATGSLDGNLRVFETETGRQVSNFMTGASVGTLAMSPSGKYMASGGSDSTMRLFELPAGTLLSQFKIDNSGPTVKATFSPDAFSPDDLFLPVAPFRGKLVKLISTASGGATQHFTFNAEVDATAVSPGGGELAVLAGTTLSVVTIPRMKEKWHRSLPDSGCCGRLNVSPDGRYLALTAARGEVHIFELEHGKEALQFRRFDRTGVMVPGWPLLPAFSPAGRYIAIANQLEESLSVVDLNTGREVGTLLEEDIFEVQLLTGPSKQFIMGVSRLPPEVHKGLGPIAGFAFSADGRYLEVAYRFSSHGTPGTGKGYSDDNETLVAKYAVHVEDLVPEVCSRVPRNLTRAEWKQYMGDEPYQKTCPSLP